MNRTEPQKVWDAYRWLTAQAMFWLIWNVLWIASVLIVIPLVPLRRFRNCAGPNVLRLLWLLQMPHRSLIGEDLPEAVRQPPAGITPRIWRPGPGPAPDPDAGTFARN